MKFFVFFLLFIVSCQDYNSNSGDRGRYGPSGLNEDDPNFERAYEIIQTRCVNCHSHQHDNWADFKSNDDWEKSGLVVPNDSRNSEFIERIVNTRSSSSNMPPSGAIPTSEYNHLVKWVNEFQ